MLQLPLHHAIFSTSSSSLRCNSYILWCIFMLLIFQMCSPWLCEGRRCPWNFRWYFRQKFRMSHIGIHLNLTLPSNPRPKTQGLNRLIKPWANLFDSANLFISNHFYAFFKHKNVSLLDSCCINVCIFRSGWFSSSNICKPTSWRFWLHNF